MTPPDDRKIISHWGNTYPQGVHINTKAAAQCTPINTLIASQILALWRKRLQNRMPVTHPRQCTTELTERDLYLKRRHDMADTYQHLLSPITIGKMQLRNRTAVTA